MDLQPVKLCTECLKRALFLKEHVMNKNIIILIVAGVIVLAFWIKCIIDFIKQIKESKKK